MLKFIKETLPPRAVLWLPSVFEVFRQVPAHAHIFTAHMTRDHLREKQFSEIRKKFHRSSFWSFLLDLNGIFVQNLARNSSITTEIDTRGHIFF